MVGSLSLPIISISVDLPAQICSYTFFFFNDTATTEIYTLSLHDALPIRASAFVTARWRRSSSTRGTTTRRSEEHTSELQSQFQLVCRLLLEKKKIRQPNNLPNKKKKKKKINYNQEYK